MSIRLTILSLILIPSLLFGNNSDEEKVRARFKACVEDKEKLESFLSDLSREEYKNATVIGYEGAARAMMAETVSSPFSKYSYFSEGTEQLESAIRKDPLNVELLYLRFLIQTNCPAILGYDSSIDKDFEKISEAIQTSSERASWMNDFLAYLKTSDALSSKRKILESKL